MGHPGVFGSGLRVFVGEAFLLVGFTTLEPFHLPLVKDSVFHIILQHLVVYYFGWVMVLTTAGLDLLMLFGLSLVNP